MCACGLLLLADGSVHGSSEEVDEQNEAEEQSSSTRRRRRRKRKKASVQDPGKNETPLTESSTGQSQVTVDAGERISKNKKRKLKKKMRKEKLMSMGLMPKAAPLEFTYNKDKEEEEEEDNERRAAELLEFLKTTIEIYMSDCKWQLFLLAFLAQSLCILHLTISYFKNTLKIQHVSKDAI